MRAENYIIKARFYRDLSKQNNISEEFHQLNNLVIRYFREKGYNYMGPGIPGLINYFESNFILASNPEKISQVKKIFGHTEDIQKWKHYSKQLKNTREDLAFEVKVFISIRKHDGVNRFVVDVTSKPCKYFKIVQLGDNPDITEQKYSFIVNENIEFLESFQRANLLSVINEPAPLNVFVKSEVSEKLKIQGFNEVAILIENSKEKMEVGKTVESIDDLIGVIEKFLYKINKDLGHEPKELHKPEKNIELLNSKGYLSNEMKGIIYGVLFNNVYLPLKDHGHKREHFNAFDLKYLILLTEQSINYIIDKVWIMKLNKENN